MGKRLTVSLVAVVALLAVAVRAQHQHSQGVDFVGQGINSRNCFQPPRHQINRIDRIASEKYRHREQLANTHQTLARSHNAGNDLRER